MNSLEWLITLSAFHLLYATLFSLFFKKEGIATYKAFIPFYNSILMLRVLDRPWWWLLLFCLPIINLVMFPVLWIDLLYAYKRPKPIEHVLTLISLGLYLFTLGIDSNTSREVDRLRPEKTKTGEWLSSIVFAIVAATLVHTYFMQPYAIPTPSLERTLRVGDFLLVSKFHYGARIPTTAIAAPMMHDTVPILKVKSYLKTPQLPYFRLPGFTTVKKNDLVVFNWPADTVRQFFVKEAGVKKPIDKKSNYVKRCVGTPGDTLEVRDGFAYINGERLQLDSRAKPMYNHKVYASSGVSSRLLAEADASDYARVFMASSLNQTQYNALIPHLIGANQLEDGTLELYTSEDGIPLDLLRSERIALKEVLKTEQLVNLTLDKADWLRTNERIDSVIMDITPKGVSGYNIFPNHPDYSWNEDNFGPVYLPKAGETIELTPSNLPLFKRIITEYEGQQLSVSDGSIYINNEPASAYTFKQGYYWMMGDNRDRSEDSRSWGHVPENHILGKPVFIWMSWDNFDKGVFSIKPRWDRFFTTVKGEGEPVSYRYVFVGLLALYFSYRFWRKRKKA